MTEAEKELRRLAQAATPGEWRAETDGGMNPLMPWRIVRPLEPRPATTARRPYHALYSTPADARFAVAAQPSAVLALLDRIEALEKQVEDAERCVRMAKQEKSAALEPALDVIREPLIEMGCTFPGGGLIGIAEGIREVVAKAERKGADEMRKAVAKFVEDASIPLPIEKWQGTKRELTAHFARALSVRIHDLPLPGDAP